MAIYTSPSHFFLPTTAPAYTPTSVFPPFGLTAPASSSYPAPAYSHYTSPAAAIYPPTLFPGAYPSFNSPNWPPPAPDPTASTAPYTFPSTTTSMMQSVPALQLQLHDSVSPTSPRRWTSSLLELPGLAPLLELPNANSRLLTEMEPGNTAASSAATPAPTTMLSAEAQAHTEAGVSEHMPSVVLDIKRRLEAHQYESQRSFDSLRGELCTLRDRLSSLTNSMVPSSASSTSTAPTSSVGFTPSVAPEVFVEMPQSSGFQNLDGRPQPYGFHNLNRQSVFLADGTEHSYFTLPADYPLEQATPTMSPSAAEHISVTPQPSVAAQAAYTSNVCKKMPVYDIYEEDKSYLNGIDEHLAKPFHKASDNASSEDVTDVTCTHAPYVFVNLSIKCSVRNNRTELPSLPDSELCGEQRKPQHGNNQQRNLLLAEMRREVWDPGDTNLHVLFMTADGATELQCTDADQSAVVPILAMHFGEKRATISEATMASQDSPASSTPLLMHVDDMQLSTSVQVAPGMFEEIPVYDDYEEDGNGSLNFFVELCDIGGQQKQYNSEKPIYDHEEPHCAAKLESDNALLVVCFNNTSDNAFSKEGTTYFRFPYGPLIHDVRSIELTKEKSTHAISILYVQATVRCDDWRSEINIKKWEVLINKHDMVYPCDLNTDKVPLSSGPCIWDPGIDLFSYKKLYHFIWIPLSPIPLIHQLHPKNFCSWWDFSLKKGRQVQWDPGIKLLLYEFWRLKTLSKGTEYAMRHLFSVKFGTHSFTYFSDTADIMCCPLPILLQHGRNVAEVLRFCRSIFNSMHHCQICHICTTMSSLFHCHGIPLWLINFQVP